MPTRYTSAYSAFLHRLKEIETILNTARRTSRKPATPANIALVNALCRSGVVLLSSHIEGYIEELGELVLDQVALRQLPKNRLGISFRYYLSQDIISQLKQVTDPEQVAGKLDLLWQRDEHVWDSHPNFRGSLLNHVFLADFANPTHKRIKKFFGRFGYDQYQNDLARRLTADFNACSNMINQVVDQRNRIAHGDLVITGTPTDLANMLKFVKQYCREADCVVGDWFRKKGCPIR